MPNDAGDPGAAFSDAALPAIAVVGQAAAALARARPRTARDLAAALVGTGLPRICAAPAHGGLGLATDPGCVLILMEVLRAVGRADLSAGRLLEGHVNVLKLAAAHADAPQRAAIGRIVAHGGMLALWVADQPDAPVQVHDGTGGPVLVGSKRFCSGATAVHGALVTAAGPGGAQLVLLGRPSVGRIDATGWQPTGMVATESFRVRLDGIPLDASMRVGPPGAYGAEPGFSAGAWRILALQLGAIEALAEGLRRDLVRTGRGGAPAQRARLAQAVISAETARLWVQQAALLAEDADADPALAIAHVGLAREAVRRAASEVRDAVQAGIGLAALLAPHPLEQTARDLATLLCQPDPDGARDRAAQAVLAAPRGIGELWM